MKERKKNMPRCPDCSGPSDSRCPNYFCHTHCTHTFAEHQEVECARQRVVAAREGADANRNMARDNADAQQRQRAEATRLAERVSAHHHQKRTRSNDGKAENGGVNEEIRRARASLRDTEASIDGHNEYTAGKKLPCGCMSLCLGVCGKESSVLEGYKKFAKDRARMEVDGDLVWAAPTPRQHTLSAASSARTFDHIRDDVRPFVKPAVSVGLSMASGASKVASVVEVAVTSLAKEGVGCVLDGGARFVSDGVIDVAKGAVKAVAHGATALRGIADGVVGATIKKVVTESVTGVVAAVVMTRRQEAERLAKDTGRSVESCEALLMRSSVV